MKADAEKLVTIHEIGDKVAESITTYFSNEDVLEVLRKLELYGLNLTYKGQIKTRRPNRWTIRWENCRSYREIIRNDARRSEERN